MNRCPRWRVNKRNFTLSAWYLVSNVQNIRNAHKMLYTRFNNLLYMYTQNPWLTLFYVGDMTWLTIQMSNTLRLFSWEHQYLFQLKWSGCEMTNNIAIHVFHLNVFFFYTKEQPLLVGLTAVRATVWSIQAMSMTSQFHFIMWFF